LPTLISVMAPGTAQAHDSRLRDPEQLRSLIPRQKRRTSGYTLTSIRVSPATLEPGRS
jgi:hypothetical protein